MAKIFKNVLKIFTQKRKIFFGRPYFNLNATHRACIHASRFKPELTYSIFFYQISSIREEEESYLVVYSITEESYFLLYNLWKIRDLNRVFPLQNQVDWKSVWHAEYQDWIQRNSLTNWRSCVETFISKFFQKSF